jgi:hypothetical protein
MAIHRWKPDPDNPVAAARCDQTDFVVGNNELVKQMQYQGTTLVWTGLWVAKQYADKPNPSAMTPVLKADPKPLRNPRPQMADDIIAGQWTYPGTSS